MGSGGVAQPPQTARKVNSSAARKSQRYIIGDSLRHPTNVLTHEGKGREGIGRKRVHSQRETTQREGHDDVLQRIGQQHNGRDVALRVTYAMSAPKPWAKYDSASIQSSSACVIFVVEIYSSATSAVGGQARTVFLLEGGTTRLSRTGPAPNVSQAIPINSLLRLQQHSINRSARCVCSREAVAPPNLKRKFWQRASRNKNCYKSGNGFSDGLHAVLLGQPSCLGLYLLPRKRCVYLATGHIHTGNMKASVDLPRSPGCCRRC